jgi:hypothetical protein
MACALGILGLVSSSRGGQDPPREGAPLFFVSKSENKNRVAYAIHVDEGCRPFGGSPVHAYWRMLERSPEAIEPLLPREEGAYGIGTQRVLSLDASGGTVAFALRSLPNRPIVAHTERRGAACAAEATTLIADIPSRLFNVHARLAWPFGLASLDITGWAEDDGRVVRETIRP